MPLFVLCFFLIQMMPGVWGVGALGSRALLSASTLHLSSVHLHISKIALLCYFDMVMCGLGKLRRCLQGKR